MYQLQLLQQLFLLFDVKDHLFPLMVQQLIPQDTLQLLIITGIVSTQEEQAVLPLYANVIHSCLHKQNLP